MAARGRRPFLLSIASVVPIVSGCVGDGDSADERGGRDSLDSGDRDGLDSAGGDEFSTEDLFGDDDPSESAADPPGGDDSIETVEDPPGDGVRWGDDTAEGEVLIEEFRHPEPRVVATDSAHQRNDFYEFEVTIENTGTAGDIGITLVFLDDPDDSVYAIGSKTVRTITRFFSDGERRTVSMGADAEPGYDGFGFRLWAAEVEVDVRNDGPAGTFEVKLLSEEELAGSNFMMDETTVDIGAGETRTVRFEGDYDNFLFERVYPEVSRVE